MVVGVKRATFGTPCEGRWGELSARGIGPGDTVDVIAAGRVVLLLSPNVLGGTVGVVGGDAKVVTEVGIVVI